MIGRRRSQTALRDDAVAGVVGFVLILALAITYYAHVAQTDVPRWGAEMERSWDADVGDAMTRLARASAAGVGTQASATITLPPPGEPRALDIPLIGRTEPIRPSGSLSFEPGCNAIKATHNLSNAVITDLTGGPTGCVKFRSDPTYSAPFAYHAEFGGLLRVQQNTAFVLSGPPLELENVSNNHYRVSLTLVGMRGTANSVAADRPGVPIDLVAAPSPPLETTQDPNAHAVTWILKSRYPTAWKAWFQDRIERAGFRSDENFACIQGDATCPAGTDEVAIVLHGPNPGTPPPGAPPDISLSLSYGIYDVTIR